MTQLAIRDKILIKAPVSDVWEAIRSPALQSQWHPFVDRIAGEHVLGAVRHCDVRVGSKAGKTEERCSVYEVERAILWTITKDTSGFSKMVTDWTAGFRLEPQGPNVTVVLAESTYRPKALLIKLTGPLIGVRFHRVQRSILRALKQFVESSA